MNTAWDEFWRDPAWYAARERKAVDDLSARVVDAKNDQPRASDRVQVMLYMWALQRTNPAYAGVWFRGRVEYKCRFGIIEPEEVNAAFAGRVAELMKEVCGPDPPRKAPSFKECQFCPLTPDDYADRVEAEMVYAGVTEEF